MKKEVRQVMSSELLLDQQAWILSMQQIYNLDV